MSIAIDFIRTHEELGFQEFIETTSKEDIDFAIKAEVNDKVKIKLKLISSNWHATEKLLGAMKELAEIASDEEEIEELSDDFDFDLGGVNERDFGDEEDEGY